MVGGTEGERERGRENDKSIKEGQREGGRREREREEKKGESRFKEAPDKSLGRGKERKQHIKATK